MSYKRLTQKSSNGLWGIDGKLINQRQVSDKVFAEAFGIIINRLAELEDKIENGTLIDINEKFIVQEEINNKIRYLICEHSPTKMVVDFANDKAEAEKKLEELSKNT